MIHVDRDEFIGWTEGVILERVGLDVFVPDEAACEAAHRALARGETVILMRNREPYSRIMSDGEVYVESMPP